MRHTIAAIVVAGVALGSCALVRTAGTLTAASPPAALARPHRIDRTVTFSSDQPEPLAPALASRARAGLGAAVPSADAVAVAGAPSPASPWDRFDGQISASSYEVARAIGTDLAVSAHPDTPPLLSLANPLPSGTPRVLLVTEDAGDWLQVLLPIRPNTSVGWVRRSDIDLSTASHRVEVDRAAHRIHVFDGDNLVVDDAIAVGRPDTPTPTGQFFTTELLEPANAGGAYGPYAFTLSAYSNVFQTFGSGDGAVGLHGTNEPRSIGRDASHGCVRLRNDTMRYLATLLPLGTPVFIR